MKSSALVTLMAAAIAPLVSAHYTFDVLVIDGVESRAIQYVRENTRREKYMPTKFINSFDGVTPLTNDFRCNLGAGVSGRTQVAQVAAGAELGMKLAFGATMQHPGPAMVYMSRAPNDDVASYDGSGDWFKIFQEGVCDGGQMTTDAWCTWDRDRINFRVPQDVPSGEYLIRVEHVGLHGAHVGEAEFYYACAQIRVTGGGSGTPGPLVKIPGVHKADDESWNFSIYGNNRDFPMPSLAVYTGGGNAGNTTEEPFVEEPVAEEPAAEEPATEEPATEEPSPTQSPSTQPSGQVPVPVDTCKARRRRVRRSRTATRLASRK